MSAIMGSVFSAATLQPVHTTVPPHKDYDETDEINEVKPRDIWPQHLLFGYWFPHETDITSTAMNRRNSEPTVTPPDAATTATMERRQSLSTGDSQSASEEFLRSIRPEPTPPEPEPEPEPTPQAPSCTICCEELPNESDPEYKQKVIMPCVSCSTSYCPPCIKNMFTGAARDSSRMPPRCCKQIHLHHARPQMTDAEVAEYKSKYEEWSTKRPFYCPVPTCSVFIPNRLLPQVQHSKDDSEKRADSGTGTPTDKFFACHACEGQICVDCRQTAHPNAMCATLDLGLDLETAKALKRWGYGRCPKCSHGVKKMYGCNRMECRCGAHFCWACKQSWDDCGNNCDSDEEYSDAEDDDDDEDAASTHNGAPDLDRRETRSWENMDLGREPANDISDQSWDCRHSFYSLAVLQYPLKPRFAQDMECAKCWRVIHPGPERLESFVPSWLEDEFNADVNIGQECDYCAIIVCVPCKDASEAALEEKLRRRRAEEDALERERERERERDNAQDEPESNADDDEEEVTATANDNDENNNDNNDEIANTQVETATSNETFTTQANETTTTEHNETPTIQTNETPTTEHETESQTDTEARPT